MSGVSERYNLLDPDEADKGITAAMAAMRAGELIVIPTDTVYGVVFDGGWPDAPHRALRNSTVKAWEAAGRPAPGRRPGEHEVLPTTRDGAQLLRYGDDLATADLVGDIEPLALYAGQSSGLIDSVQPAAVIAQTPGRRRPASAQPTRRKAHLTRGSGGVQDTDAEWKCLPLIGHERYFVTWTRAAALEQGRRTTSDLRGSPVPRWRT
jgi:hypothetical protein